MKLKICPVPSTAVTSSVCSSVPNLSMPTSSGNEQFSNGPPSNEHITDCGFSMGQKKVCRPGPAEVEHEISMTISHNDELQ